MPNLAPASLAAGSQQWELAAADDAQVVALLGSEEARVNALVAALASFGSPVPWTGTPGTVRLEVVLPDAAVHAVTIRFDAQGARISSSDDPEVALRVPLVPFVRLLTGRADGALLYLSGVLEVVGSESLVLALGTALRVGPEARPLVDPAALDPVAVSRAIADVRTEHLAAVMAGGFRDLVLSEVFGRFPEFVIAEKAAQVRVAIAFEIAGRPGGGADRYVVRLRDGNCEVLADAAPDEPVDATLELEGHEFLRLVLGHLNPVRGVLSGQVRVRGQVVKALGFNAVMRIPGS